MMQLEQRRMTGWNWHWTALAMVLRSAKGELRAPRSGWLWVRLMATRQALGCVKRLALALPALPQARG